MAYNTAQHLNELQIEELCLVLEKEKEVPKQMQSSFDHVIQCRQCFIELQETWQDMLAMEEAGQLLTPKVADQSSRTFEIMLKQMTRGFELLKSNVKGLLTQPMPVYRSSGTQGSIGAIHFILFFKGQPIKVSLESDSLTNIIMRFNGLIKQMKSIKIKSKQKDHEKIIWEFSVQASEHNISISKEQLYQNQFSVDTTLIIYASDQFLGQIMFNPEIEDQT